ncbi:MAG TPA: hypothetical protein ENJ31_12380 [Anaerolineae bacterium]|nr:hypothetical protein [Anaerolineae bacterium]
MIPERDLELLRSFDSRESVALSVYLRLDTPAYRDSAYDVFLQQVQARLDECGAAEECRRALQEDMEIVGLYLKTNGHRQHAGLVIFSCAAELFWRAYPLSVPVPNQVTVGPRFDLSPLRQAAAG